MNILTLDTSTEVCSVALEVAGQRISRYDDSGAKNTDIILPMIDEMVREAGIQPADLDVLGFARGPGSFTGVRVATGIAQGIAFGVGVKVAPVSTLAMLALRAHRQTGESVIYTVNDARMKEVYAACYQVESSSRIRLLEAERVTKPEALEVEANAGLIVGTGWAAYTDALQQQFQGDWQVNQDIKPHAEDLLDISRHMAEQNQLCEPEAALPVYLRDNVAKKKGER